MKKTVKIAGVVLVIGFLWHYNNKDSVIPVPICSPRQCGGVYYTGTVDGVDQYAPVGCGTVPSGCGAFITCICDMASPCPSADRCTCTAACNSLKKRNLHSCADLFDTAKSDCITQICSDEVDCLATCPTY